MNFFHHKDLENHLLQLCPKVVKHPVLGQHSTFPPTYVHISQQVTSFLVL